MGSPQSQHLSYRPFTILTFRWNAALLGRDNVVGFHAVNMVLNGIATVLFTLVCELLCRRSEVSVNVSLCTRL